MLCNFPTGARPKLLQMSGLATTSVSNNRPSIRPSIIRCKAINSVTVTEIPVQLEPMRRTSSPTASDFYLRQHRTTISDSVGLLSPTASDYNLRQRRTSISDSVELQSPTASDCNLRQRQTTISDSVRLQSPTASDYNLRQRRTSISNS